MCPLRGRLHGLTVITVQSIQTNGNVDRYRQTLTTDSIKKKDKYVYQWHILSVVTVFALGRAEIPFCLVGN